MRDNERHTAVADLIDDVCADTHPHGGDPGAQRRLLSDLRTATLDHTARTHLTACLALRTTDPQLRDRLTRHPNPDVVAAAVRTIDRADPAWLRRRVATVAADAAATDGPATDELRDAAAQSNATSPATHRRLAAHPDPDTRRAVAASETAPADARLTALASVLADGTGGGATTTATVHTCAYTAFVAGHRETIFDIATVGARHAATGVDAVVAVATALRHLDPRTLVPTHVDDPPADRLLARAAAAIIDAAGHAAARTNDPAAALATITSHVGDVLAAAVAAGADPRHADTLAGAHHHIDASAPLLPHIAAVAALPADAAPPDRVTDADLADLVDPANRRTSDDLHAGLLLAARLASTRRVVAAAARTRGPHPHHHTLITALTSRILPPASRRAADAVADAVVDTYPARHLLTDDDPQHPHVAERVARLLAHLTPGQAAALPDWHQPLPDLAATPL